MKLASAGRISTQRETSASLLERWLEHIEARGQARKTLPENRRTAAVIADELGRKELDAEREALEEDDSAGPNRAAIKGWSVRTHLNHWNRFTRS